MSFVTNFIDTSVLYGLPPDQKLANIQGLEDEIAAIHDPKTRQKMIELVKNTLLIGGAIARRMPMSARSVFFHCDSRNRNTTLYPNPNQYTIPLPYTYKQVYGVRVAAGVLEKSVVASPENYIFLRIKNLPGNYIANNTGGHGAFCLLIIDRFDNFNQFRNPVMEINGDMSAYYESPLDRLSHLEISFVTRDGNLYPSFTDHFLLFQIFYMSSLAIK